MTSLEKSSPEPTSEYQYLTFMKHIRHESLIAGVSGGAISTLILHPFDLLKIRFEVNDGVKYNPKYKGIWHGFATIAREDGLKGLYRGAWPNVLGAGTSWGLYFYFYSGFKAYKQKGNLEKPLKPLDHIIAASQSGVLTLLITNPIWVSKTRLCLQMSSKYPHVETYKGVTDTLLKLYKKEGLYGWYRGLVPGLIGVSHGAIQFTIYEEMKNSYNKYKSTPITTKLGVAEYIIFAAVSKLIAVTSTYPYQVVRVRLQNQFYSYNGLFDCILQMVKSEGWTGFYKGLGTNLLRVVPATMITFVVYEYSSNYLKSG